MQFVCRYIPLFEDLKSYNKGVFRADLMAGLTVGVVLIPQSMAYAMLAGMPLIYGLYGSLIPILIYGILGSSRQLSVGPVAISALLVVAGVSQFFPANSPEFISYVILLGLLIGLLQCVLGLLKLGFVFNFISHPVIAGFISAAAILIATTQLDDFLGLPPTTNDNFYHSIIHVVDNFSSINPITASYGLAALVMIIIGKKIKKSFPAALFAVILGVLISYFTDSVQNSVSIIGDVPAGLPSFVMPALKWEAFELLIPTLLTVTLIGVVESISIAKSLEAKNRTYTINPDQELWALGISKIVGSFFQAMPTSGSFTRSAVNMEAGARTGISSVVSAFLVLVTLLFITPLFYFLPKAILAAIILAAVFGLFDYGAFINLWKIHKQDFWMMVITFLGTLFVGIEMGVLLGVVLSLLGVIYRSSKPHLAVLGKIPGTTSYRNLERFEEVETIQDILIIRFEEMLYFGNAVYFRDKIKKLVSGKEGVQFVLLDAGSMNSIDSTGIDVLRDLDIFLAEQHIELHLSGAIGTVRDILYKSGLMREPDKHHMSIHRGVEEITRWKENDIKRRDEIHKAMQTNVRKKP